MNKLAVIKAELQHRLNFHSSAVKYPQPWAQWLITTAPKAISCNDGSVHFSKFHKELWEWVYSIEPNASSISFLQIVFRGGGKSANAELATAYLAGERIKKYGIYVCDTQAQADNHILTISQLFQSKGIIARYPRLGRVRVDDHQRSLGWNAKRISTEDGFTMDAIGLDRAYRGFKMEFQRPDWVVVDDIDNTSDSVNTVLKKEATLSRNIFSALSTTASILAVQNFLRSGSVFHRIYTGDNGLLSKRITSGPYPALLNPTHTTDGEGNTTLTGGTPTWKGYGIKECQDDIDKIDWTSFLVEQQHELEYSRSSFLGDIWRSSIHMIDMFHIPPSWYVDRSFDWGTAKPWCCIWWAESDGSPYIDPATGDHVYCAAGTVFGIAEMYGWSGKANTGSRDNNDVIAQKILRFESSAAWGNRVRPGPADSSIFIRKGGKSIADEMSDVGLRWTESDRRPGSRINGASVVRDRLAASVTGAIERPGLYFFKNCFHVGRTFPLLPEDIRRDGDVDTDSEDHLWDTTRYRVYEKRTILRNVKLPWR